MKRKDLMIVLLLLLVAAGVFFYTQTLNPVNSHPGAKQGLSGATLTFEPEDENAEGLTLSALLFETAYAQEAPAAPEASAAPEQNPSPAILAPEASPAPEIAEGLEDAESYLCVWMGEQFKLVPLNQEGKLRLRQSDDMENVIAIGKNCFHMDSSTCENQDCVQQGEVTLENREERVLFNWVVCLPNQVMLELLSKEEALTLLKESEAIS